LQLKSSEIFSAVDQKIIDFISGSRVHIDDLISSTGLSSADILSALTTLELKGMVRQYREVFFPEKINPLQKTFFHLYRARKPRV